MSSEHNVNYFLELFSRFIVLLYFKFSMKCRFFRLYLSLFLSNIYLKMKMLWTSVNEIKKASVKIFKFKEAFFETRLRRMQINDEKPRLLVIKKPPLGGLNYCLFASKHSLQYTGLAFVGLNGTWVSLPQSAHTVSYITTSLL